MLIRRRWSGRAVALAVAAVIGMTLVPARAAHAAGPLSPWVGCSTVAQMFNCNLIISGGTGPFSVAWFGANFGGTSTSGSYGFCRQFFSYQIDAVVTDSTGATATGSRTFVCKGGMQT